MKLGSLFDGSGGFPLAGVINGITPVWASEIEPFPIRVTKNRFPNMKHLGSVTDINGAEIEPVDIITFGSPCQDLSVAGKQAGIHDGQRSNLFFEAVRIIKEMRDATSDKYPRFAVWENVPGVFSSNKGADFKSVLETLCRIKEPNVSVPRPERGGWKPAGHIMGTGYSIAWRVYDAQYWGVPQRRKRVYLISDFGSECAGEILFEHESLSGNSESSGKAGQGTPGDAKGSAGRGSYLNSIVCFDVFDMLETKMEKTLTSSATDSDHIPVVCYGIENHANDSRVTLQKPNEPCQTLTSRMGTGGGNVPLILEPVCIGNGQTNQAMGRVVGALNCMHDQQAVITPGKPPRKYIIRRLTPKECGRLQGFPDGWADDAKGSDTAKYKMWGNGIALPCAIDVLGRIAKEMRKSHDYA